MTGIDAGGGGGDATSLTADARSRCIFANINRPVNELLADSVCFIHTQD